MLKGNPVHLPPAWEEKAPKRLMVPNGCGERCNLDLNRKIPSCSGIHFSFHSRRQNTFYVYILMVKGYFGAGLCFISLVQRQLGIILPAGVMLNVCPEQRPKKQICLEGIIV